MDPQRTISGIIALTWLAVAFVAIDAAATFRLAIFLLFPVACIWFSDSIGEYTGAVTGRNVSAASPGWMIAIGGWIMLFIPAILGTIWYAQK